MKARFNIYFDTPVNGVYISKKEMVVKDIDDINTRSYLLMKEELNIKKIEVEPYLKNGAHLDIMVFNRKTYK